MSGHLLILGGTSEASRLADAVAARGLRATLSYAGRVADPREQPIPVRVGGFGGRDGLADWMRAHDVTHLVDTTHPFATQISANAVDAANDAAVPCIAFVRPPWRPVTGDRWTSVADRSAALAALPDEPTRVLLAIGRQWLDAFTARPEHHYILRLVDPPTTRPPLARHTVIVSRGPFEVSGDAALLAEHRVALVVAKNSGGTGAAAKLVAAREARVPVIMIERPVMAEVPSVGSVDEVLHWLDHPGTGSGVERGV